jgi:hypothetical protein
VCNILLRKLRAVGVNDAEVSDHERSSLPLVPDTMACK